LTIPEPLWQIDFQGRGCSAGKGEEVPTFEPGACSVTGQHCSITGHLPPSGHTCSARRESWASSDPADGGPFVARPPAQVQRGKADPDSFGFRPSGQSSPGTGVAWGPPGGTRREQSLFAPFGGNLKEKRMSPSHAGPRPTPDIHWNDDRHATVFHNGRVWDVREDEASDWWVFLSGRPAPVHRITSGGCSEAFRWIAGRPRA
jgi:hypothetical protein